MKKKRRKRRLVNLIDNRLEKRADAVAYDRIPAFYVCTVHVYVFVFVLLFAFINLTLVSFRIYFQFLYVNLSGCKINVRILELAWSSSLEQKKKQTNKNVTYKRGIVKTWFSEHLQFFCCYCGWKLHSDKMLV